MSSLPAAIQTFFHVSNGENEAALSQCFAEDAVVHDEKRDHHGVAQIRDWLVEARAKYQYEIEPLRAVHDNGKYIVTARVAGTFPGSPIEVDHVFALDRHGLVASLKIG